MVRNLNSWNRWEWQGPITVKPSAIKKLSIFSLVQQTQNFNVHYRKTVTILFLGTCSKAFTLTALSVDGNILTQNSPEKVFCSSYLVKDWCSDRSLTGLKSQLLPLFMFHCMYFSHHFYFSLSIRVTYGMVVWFNRYQFGKNPRRRTKGPTNRIKPASYSWFFRLRFLHWNGHTKNFPLVIYLFVFKSY